mgnify:CR=1 FL=1
MVNTEHRWQAVGGCGMPRAREPRQSGQAYRKEPDRTDPLSLRPIYVDPTFLSTSWKICLDAAPAYMYTGTLTDTFIRVPLYSLNVLYLNSGGQNHAFTTKLYTLN